MIRAHTQLLFALLVPLSALVLRVRTLEAQVDDNDIAWQQSVARFDVPRHRVLAAVDATIAQGPFNDTWDSLSHYEPPTWYEDAKFGIFIHWGIYAVPAFHGEWYARHMYEPTSDQYKHQVALHGPVNAFGYKDYIPLFKGEDFNASQWVDIFADAGAQYVIPVAEHHDGFQMYRSDLSDWNSVKLGPHRDVLGELRASILAHGLHFGLSSHRAEHYFFLNTGREIDSDVNDTQYASFYGPAHKGVMIDKNVKAHPDANFLDDWLARSAELVQKYHPELVYFDWWIEQTEFAPYLKKFAAFYYDEAARSKVPVVLFRKNNAFPVHTTVLDIERGQLDRIQQEHWQTDTSVTASAWGYVEGATYKKPQELIWDLIDIVSKNGNLLLNVGPKADGTLPAEAISILHEMGSWLRVNGEAVYGSRPWITYGEGPHRAAAGTLKEGSAGSYSSEDIRFTTHSGFLYAFVMAWPTDNTIHIRSLARSSDISISSAQLLGSSEKVRLEQGDADLGLVLPRKPHDSYAYIFKLGIEPKRGGSDVR